MSDPSFLDTNILMYAVGSDHPLKKPCIKILEKVSQGEIIAVTDTEVFQEVAYRYWAQNKWDIATQVLKDYEFLFSEIYAVEQAHLKNYYSLLSDYPFLSPRDAIHISVIQAHEIKIIYTADQAFKRIPSLTVISPA